MPVAWFFECSWVVNNNTLFAVAYGATDEKALETELGRWFALERVDTIAAAFYRLGVWEVERDGTLARFIDLAPHVKVTFEGGEPMTLTDPRVARRMRDAEDEAEARLEAEIEDPDVEMADVEDVELEPFRFSLDWASFEKEISALDAKPLAAGVAIPLHQPGLDEDGDDDASDGDETVSFLDDKKLALGWWKVHGIPRPFDLSSLGPNRVLAMP